jgi:hypothetical protein
MPIPRPCSRLLCAVLFLLPMALEAQPVRVSGRVVDHEGIRGASGARIELLPAREDYAAAVRRLREEPESKPLATARSDAGGFFEIAAPEAGAYRLRVLAEGYLTFEHPLVPLVEDTALEPVPLVHTEPFEIRTLTKEGRPLAGVEIRSFPDPSMAGYSGWREDDRGGVTGAAGRLVLRRVRGERLNLVAISPAFLGQSGTPAEDGRPVVLAPRPPLRIEVQDAGGQPVSDALIRWRSQPVGLTGPDGRLEVVLPPGDEPLTVESREGHWATISARPAATASVLPVRLAPPRILAGRVVSASTSAPLPNALVWAGGLPGSPARTAADGGFRLTLSTPEEVILEAAAAGHLRPESRFVPSASSRPLVLRLQPAVRISGQVVDEEGRPVSGTWLQVTPTMPKGSPTQALSRADGSFQLSGLAFKGSYEINASRQGFVASSLKVRTPAPGQPPAPVRLVLKSGQTVFGRVASEAGTPVAGARLTLFREPFGGSEIFRAVSDAEGRFEIRALATGRFTLWVLGEGFAPFHRTVEVPAEPKRADLGVIELPAGAWIEGQVTDTQGTSIAAARVWTDLGPVPSMAEEPDAQTDSQGRFHLRAPRGTPIQLIVHHEGYIALQVPGVEAPTREALHLELKAARSLSGRVVGPDGEPVANVTLTRVDERRLNNSLSRSESPLGRTDAQGLFHISGLEPGPTDVRVSAEGYTTRMMRGVPIPQDQDLEGLEIALNRWNVLRIRVLSPDGGPIANALLRAEPQSAPKITNIADLEMFSGTVGSCLTDERGTCQAEIREPGAYRVSAVVGQREASVLVEAERGATPVELRMPKAREVSGLVMDRQGKGLAGATVRLTEGRRSSQETLTGEDGSFTLQDVADGLYALTANRQGFLQSGGPRDLRVEGADVHGLEIQLVEGEEGATLTGRLLGLAPEEVERAKVRAFSADLQEEGDVGTDGTYRISGLSPGDWTVLASASATNRQLQAVARIEPGASGSVLDFDFGKGFTLSGKVLVDGAPLANAEVTVMSPNGNQTAQTSYDGRFQIRNLSPGPSFLMVLASRGALGQDQELEMDGDREMTLEIRTGVLRGQVVSEGTGEPIAEATVLIQGVGTGLRAFFSAPTTRSTDDGAFEARLATGTYKITVQKDGYGPAGATVEVRPGAAGAPIEIRLKRE